jgi:surfactin synthase thioesterase subunit
MAGVDQMAYAPGIAAQVLVQNGSRDTTYTVEQMRSWQERIGGAKTVKNYDAGHDLDTASRADALSWIAERWRLP